MKKKTTVYTEKTKLDNALFNLTRYANFIENTSFVIHCVSVFMGVLLLFLGFMSGNNKFMWIGFLMAVISVAIYVLLIKPLLLIIYAVCKILINSEKSSK